MSFDPAAFAHQQVDPLTTQYELVPEGEFQMMIDADPKQLEPRTIKFNDKNSGEPREFYQLELNCIVNDDRVRAKLQRDRVTCRMRVNLDLDANGRLETGPNKNVALGQLRDALGQNKPGWSPSALLGAGPFIGKVTHTASKDNKEVKYANVVKAVRIS